MPLIFNLAYRYLQNGQRHVPGGLFNTAALMAPKIAEEYGLDGVQFFPMTMSQSGTAADGDGYGKLRDGQISPTRFAQTDAEILRSIACLHACGLVAGSDEVTHQYDGEDQIKGTNILYPEYGEGMVLGAGDFNKPIWGFVGAPPRSPIDNVFDSIGNFLFGDGTSFTNSGHDGYMLQGMIRTMVRRARYTDFDFWRHDDAKGTAVSATNAFIKAMAEIGKYGYAEVFVGYIPELQNWFYQTGYRLGLLDFPLHWMLANACNGYNANSLRGEALCHTNPALAWKNRDTGDTDDNEGQSVAANGLIANLRVLTTPGENALMYGKDYLPYSENGYNMAEKIANYTWIAKNLAFGDEVQRWGNDGAVAVFERLGSPGLLTSYNFDTYNNREVTVQTNFGPFTELWEYTGTYHKRFGKSSIWTDGQGRATYLQPCNAFSRADNSLCWSRAGYTAPFAKLPARTTTNVFEGAANLIIPRATAAGSVAGKIWCDVGHAIDLNKTAGDGVRFVVSDVKGNIVIPHGKWEGKTVERGYHTITAYSGSSDPEGYEVAATYMGTKGITAEDLAAEETPKYPEATERGQARIEARLAKRRVLVQVGVDVPDNDMPPWDQDQAGQ